MLFQSEVFFIDITVSLSLITLIEHFGYFADVSHKLGFGLEVVPALRVLDGKYKLSCKITRFLSLVFIC